MNERMDKQKCFSPLLLLTDCELFQLRESKKTYSTLWFRYVFAAPLIC